MNYLENEFKKIRQRMPAGVSQSVIDNAQTIFYAGAFAMWSLTAANNNHAQVVPDLLREMAEIAGRTKLKNEANKK